MKLKLKMTKQVEAYFCSWCYPPGEDMRREGRWFPFSKPWAELKIKWTDQKWEVVWRRPIKDNELESFKPEMARVILEHFLGGAVTEYQVLKLITMPGISLCRIEPKILERFLQGELF